MIDFEAQFSFFKAGQGAFYAGLIKHPKHMSLFTVVYDCGTIGKRLFLDNEIDHFKIERHNFSFSFPRNSDTIDLLFISHLDSDHVKGLKRLLTEFKVLNIILPYIKKHDRQFFLLSFSSEEVSPETENEYANLTLSEEEYFKFIEKPAPFIAEFNEDTNIYFVNPETTSSEYQGYDSDNEMGLYPRGNIITNIEEFANEPNVKVYENNLQFFLEKDWEFTTHVKGVNKEAISKLNISLKTILNKNHDDDILSIDDLKILVTEKKNAAQLCYKNNIGEINSHGLILLHGPIGKKNIFCQIISEIDPKFDYENPPHKDGTEYIYNINQKLLGTLLLGDTSLKTKNNPCLPDAFKDKLTNVHIMQIPHHGSEENWDLEEFNKLEINKENENVNNLVTVCNVGHGRTKHPSPVVLQDLKSTLFLNTQYSRLTISYFINKKVGGLLSMTI